MADHPLLAEVKERYPIGTVVKCAYGNTKTHVVESYNWHELEYGIWSGNNTWLYMKGHGWATVLSKLANENYKIY